MKRIQIKLAWIEVVSRTDFVGEVPKGTISCPWVLRQQNHYSTLIKDDIKKLRKQLDDNPELFRHVVDLSDSIQDMLVSKLAETNKALQIGVKANMMALPNGMSYRESPV